MAGKARAKSAHIWQRNELDWYVEESRASEALFKVEPFIGPVHDPACGGGNIVKAALQHGLPATGSDIVRRVDPAPTWFTGERDFLDGPPLCADINIVTNPPFFRGKGTEDFIRRALTTVHGKVAIFTSIKFLAGAKRAEGLFTEHPPARIWIVTPRVSCPPGEYLAAGNKAGGGADDWCWIVYPPAAQRPASATRMDWLKTRGGA